MKKKHITVRIPTDLYHKIEERMREKAKKSVEEYIVKTLEENISAERSGPDDISRKDEEKIKERLKALGYMD